MTVEIVKEFNFDAAHFLPTAPEGHPYRRLHGHSFRVEVALVGEPEPATGWLVDFGLIERRIAALRDRLDHNLLNEIEGLNVPTLENLAAWIHRELRTALPGLERVTIRRESSGESCTYRPRR
ncbi:MAG TPA: 6-carboxytetrahydropterin synthase QueD [Stellaceae bacterium]|nr:6-carboxytetrahydropterin synthase QueD [Stellaceae bacterium]